MPVAAYRAPLAGTPMLRKPATAYTPSNAYSDVCKPRDHGLTNTPPNTVPSKAAQTTEISIQPLATTRRCCGTISVTSPYFAGAYAAAPKPAMVNAATGCRPDNSAATPTALTAFMHAIKRAFGNASASAPTNGANQRRCELRRDQQGKAGGHGQGSSRTPMNATQPGPSMSVNRPRARTVPAPPAGGCSRHAARVRATQSPRVALPGTAPVAAGDGCS